MQRLLQRERLVLFELDVRVATAERLSDVGDGRVVRVLREPHLEVAALGAANLPGLARRLLDQDENPTGPPQQNLPGLGQRDVVLRSIEKEDPQLSFELPDLLAKGRLGEVHPSGRAAEVQLLGHCDEIS